MEMSDMSRPVRIDEERGQEHVAETCCCGCCSVKHGTIILGILSIVGSLSTLLDANSDHGVGAGAQDAWSGRKAPQNGQFIRGLECAWAIITLILAGLLFQGICAENSKFVRPYLCWLNFEFSISVVAAFLIGIIVFIGGWGEHGLFGGLAYGAVYGVLVYLLLFVEWYFINVVRRYEKELHLGNTWRSRNYTPAR